MRRPLARRGANPRRRRLKSASACLRSSGRPAPTRSFGRGRRKSPLAWPSAVWSACADRSFGVGEGGRPAQSRVVEAIRIGGRPAFVSQEPLWPGDPPNLQSVILVGRERLA
ncbi:MAG: hypothetical protein N3B68_05800 [Anaerolineae bacterium]|nr:hypothetical protein [Anaerolineae bacterium]